MTNYVRHFTDKVVLITGSSSGIGLETATQFAELGCRVVITGRDKCRVAKAAAACKSASPSGRDPHTVIGDVTNKEEAKNIIESTIAQFGKLDILINNAGGGNVSNIEDEDLWESFDNMMTLNAKSALYMCHLAVPHLEKTKGCIVSNSAIAGLRPVVGFLTYCMAKSAMDAMTRILALELAPRNIRVNSVNPGMIPTGFQAGLGMSQETATNLVEGAKSVFNFSEAMNPSSIAKTIVFLASSDAGFISGQTLLVDGGAYFTPHGGDVSALMAAVGKK